MIKTSATVKSRNPKHLKSSCNKLMIGFVVFSCSYASIYIFLYSLVQHGDEVLATGSNAPPNAKFNVDDFKHMEGFQGARWLHGKEALEALENMKKGKNGRGSVKPEDVGDMASAIKQVMAQMSNDETGENKNKAHANEL